MPGPASAVKNPNVKLEPTIMLIARMWHGRTRAGDADEYWRFLLEFEEKVSHFEVTEVRA